MILDKFGIVNDSLYDVVLMVIAVSPTHAIAILHRRAQMCRRRPHHPASYIVGY